jgi:hypothetical protein
MPDGINFNPNIRALPIYQSGFSAGVDVGLFMGLTALTAESVHQQTLAESTPDLVRAARHGYAAAVLIHVTRVLAARFRTLNHTQGR